MFFLLELIPLFVILYFGMRVTATNKHKEAALDIIAKHRLLRIYIPHVLRQVCKVQKVCLLQHGGGKFGHKNIHFFPFRVQNYNKILIYTRNLRKNIYILNNWDIFHKNWYLLGLSDFLQWPSWLSSSLICYNFLHCTICTICTFPICYILFVCLKSAVYIQSAM